MANPSPPKPPSIYDIGLKTHLGDELYAEFVQLCKSDISNPGIARILLEKGLTERLVDDRTIKKWRDVNKLEGERDV